MLKLIKAEWDTGFPFRPKTSANSTRLTHETAQNCGISEGLIPLWLFFARPLAPFLRQHRHFSRSRALARSLLSFLASSKLHPTGGKKRQHSRSVKTYQGGMGYRVPISPQDVSNQYPANPRKTPHIVGFQRGSAPLVGSGAKPRRGLGQRPNGVWGSGPQKKPHPKSPKSCRMLNYLISFWG